MKRKLLILTFIAVTLLLLASCTGNGDPADTSATPDSSTQSEPETTAQIENVLSIAADGKTSFKICRAEKATSEVIALTQKILTEIKTYTGASPKLTDDWMRPGETADPEAYEILVGATNRPESASVIDTLNKNDYAICVVGNKIVIAGTTYATTERAVTYFLNNFVYKQGTKDGTATLSMSEKDNYLYKATYKITSLTCLGHDIREFKVVIPENNSISEYRSAVLIAETIANRCGAVLNIVTDAVAENEYEIVIGNVKRQKAEASDDNYTVSASGTKLYVNAGSLYAYLELCDYVDGTLLSAKNSTVSIDNGFVYTAKAANTVAERSGEIRVMFNNVLGNCDESIYPVPQRSRQLAELFLEYKPDVIGFQECSPASRGSKANIITLLSSEYKEVPVKATNSNSNNYTPLLYRPDVLEVVDSGYLLYSDGMNDKSKSATWAVFRVIATEKQFAACSTHFYWNDDGARQIDADQIDALIDKVLAKYNCPVFTGGDFNCNVSSKPYSMLIKQNFLDVQKLAPDTINSKGYHAYPVYNFALGIYDSYTLPSGEYSAAIDHIFMSGEGAAVKKFRSISDEYALLSSDHCPLYVDFDFK